MRIDVSLDHRNLDAELAGLHARMRTPGDALHGLPAIATSLPHLAFRYREVDGEFHVYVEDPARPALAGCTVFQRVPEVDRRVDACIRSPHSRYAQDYRGQGIASAVYAWALQAGMCLVSGPRQSPAAHRLWMALARTYEIAFVQVADKRLRIMEAEPHPAALQDLGTRMLLLGAGWTLHRFAGAAATAP
jgi:hypothetical protein